MQNQLSRVALASGMMALGRDTLVLLVGDVNLLLLHGSTVRSLVLKIIWTDYTAACTISDFWIFMLPSYVNMQVGLAPRSLLCTILAAQR
jgi:UDP-2,3-diacylglucosamine pyrophosphatase LpxH